MSKFTIHVIKSNEALTDKKAPKSSPYEVTDTLLDLTANTEYFLTNKKGKVFCNDGLVYKIVGDADLILRTNFKLYKPFFSILNYYIKFEDNIIITEDKEYGKEELKGGHETHKSILTRTSSKACDLVAFVINHYRVSGYNIDREFDAQENEYTSSSSRKYFSIGRDAFIKQSPKAIEYVKNLLNGNFDTAADPVFECDEKDGFAVFTRALTLYSMSSKAHKLISTHLISESSPFNVRRTSRGYTHYPDYITDGTLSSETRTITRNQGVMDAGVNVHVVTAHETPNEDMYKNDESLADEIDHCREHDDQNLEITKFDLLEHISDYLYPERERPIVNSTVLIDYESSSNSEELTKHAMLSLSDNSNAMNENMIESVEKANQRISALLDAIVCNVKNQSDFETKIWIPAIQNNPNFKAKLTRKYSAYYTLLTKDPAGWSYLSDFFRHFFIFLTEKQLDPSITQCIYLHLWKFYTLQFKTQNTWRPLFDGEPEYRDEMPEFLRKKANSLQHRSTKKAESPSSDEHDAGQSLYLQVISALFTQLCTLA